MTAVPEIQKELQQIDEEVCSNREGFRSFLLWMIQQKWYKIV